MKSETGRGDCSCPFSLRATVARSIFVSMPARTQRLVLALAAKDHKLIARAARVQGLTSSAFATTVLVDESQRIVDEASEQRRGLQVLKLFASIVREEKPNSPLRRAVREVIGERLEEDEPTPPARRKAARKRGQVR